jgi:hypothetical protein
MWANMLELADIDSKSQSTQVETADIRSIRVSLKRSTLKAKQARRRKTKQSPSGDFHKSPAHGVLLLILCRGIPLTQQKITLDLR